MQSLPIKIPMMFFRKVEKFFLKFIWSFNGLQIAKKILKNKTGRFTLPNFKTYYKATIIKQCGICINTDM